LLSNCRVQPILCKDSANEGNESLLSNCRVQPIFYKDKHSIETLSPFYRKNMAFLLSKGNLLKTKIIYFYFAFNLFFHQK
ncbi:MAG: hypothetical protein E7D78_05825, partial [Prevotella bivia]|nr:hypothetical protein [Prevotella bivia]